MPIKKESTNTMNTVMKGSSSFDQSFGNGTSTIGHTVIIPSHSHTNSLMQSMPKKDKFIIPLNDYSTTMANIKFPSLGGNNSINANAGNTAAYTFSSSINKSNKIKDKNDLLKKSFTTSNGAQAHNFNTFPNYTNQTNNTPVTGNTLNTNNTVITNNTNSSKDNEKEINLNNFSPNFNFPVINSNINSGHVNNNNNVIITSSLPSYGINNHLNSAKKKPNANKISLNSMQSKQIEQNIKNVLGLSNTLKPKKKPNFKKNNTVQSKISTGNYNTHGVNILTTNGSESVGNLNNLLGSTNTSPGNNNNVINSNTNTVYNYNSTNQINNTPKINYINIQNNYINYSNRTTSHNELLSSMNKIGTFLKQQNAKINTPRHTNSNITTNNTQHIDNDLDPTSKDIHQLKQLDELIKKIEHSTGHTLDENIAQYKTQYNKKEDENVNPDIRIKKYGILFEFINSNLKEITDLMSKKAKNTNDYYEGTNEIIENISREKKESRRNIRYNDLLQDDLILFNTNRKIDDKDKLIKDYEVEDSIDHIKKIIALNNYTNKNKIYNSPNASPKKLLKNSNNNNNLQNEDSFLDSSVNSEFYINLMNEHSQDKEIGYISLDLTNMQSYANAKQILEKEKLEETECQFDGVMFSPEDENRINNGKINIISNDMTYELLNKSTERTRNASVDPQKLQPNCNNVLFF